MKKTALYDVHKALGAKMISFAGYEMPVSYTGVIDEHLTVREGVGVFDVSHMGEFMVEGQGALPFLQYITSNDVSKLSAGKVQYSCFPNGEGGIVDDLLIYCFGEQSYMLVVNASNIEKDWKWLEKHNSFGAKLRNVSDELSLFAVQGPRATLVLRTLTAMNLKEMKYYTFEKGAFLHVDNVIVSATGYTGSGGFEIYVPNADAEQVWQAIMAAGAVAEIKPIGLAARDTLRLEMGFCLYGNDIDDSTSPLEAGLGWITKFNKEFIDKERLHHEKTHGTTRRLVGFEMVDRGIPRLTYPILNVEGETIGHVTSGTQSPSLNKAIGMGYVATTYVDEGTEIYIDIRGKAVKAIVVKPPFYSAE
jgi:aminomethyltransferase